MPHDVSLNYFEGYKDALNNAQPEYNPKENQKNK